MKKRKSLSGITAAVLAAAMLFTSIPTTVWADEAETGTNTVLETVEEKPDSPVTDPEEITGEELKIQDTTDLNTSEDPAIENEQDTAMSPEDTGSAAEKSEIADIGTDIADDADNAQADTAVPVNEEDPVLTDETGEPIEALGVDEDPSDFLTIDLTGDPVSNPNYGFLKASGSAVIGNVAVIPKAENGTAITIPAGLFTSGEFAGITRVEFEDGCQIKAIQAHAFESTMITAVNYVPVTAGFAIEPYVFSDSSLTTISFVNSENITSIGDYAFSGTHIRSFSAPDAATVGAHAFDSCSDLLTVSMNKLESIGAYAFQNCGNLGDSMSFSALINEIGNNAFYGCGFTALDLTRLDFENCTLGIRIFENNKSLTSVSLPSPSGNIETTIELPMYTFSGCEKLTTANVNCLTIIRSGAFSGCKALKTISLRYAVQIDTKAFEGCTALTTITLGEYVATIAEDAFPTKSGITLQGYNETARSYAEKKKYTYKSLAIHTVKYGSTKLTTAPANAEAGKTVRVTFNAGSGKYLQSYYFQDSKSNTVPSVVDSTSGNTYVFKLTMPDDDITLVPSCGTLSASSQAIYSVGSPAVFNESDKSYTFKTAGYKAQLTIAGTQPYWWDYSSSTKTAASISTVGVIQAVGEDQQTTITATLKGNTNVKITFTVHVGEKERITKLSLYGNEEEFPIGEGREDAILGYPVERAKVFSEEGSEEDPPVFIEFEQHALSTSAQTFEISINAYATEDSEESLITTTDWKTNNTAVATLGAAKSTDNKNKITVPKGALGTARITVTSTYKKENKPSATYVFYIRVLDATPRLVVSETGLTVSRQSTVGIKLDIRTVYGEDYEIYGNQLTVVKSETVNKETTRKDFSDLTISYKRSEGAYYLKASTSATIKAYTSGVLYLKGFFTGTSEEFYIPIIKLSVVNTKPNPTVKTTGSINLFYNRNGYSVDGKYTGGGGKVELTQSLENEPLDAVWLISEKNYADIAKGGYGDVEDPDPFDTNFDLIKTDEDDYKTFYIIRSDENDIMKDSEGKEIVSGYVCFKYAGYEDIVYRKVTISYTNSRPGFALEKSAVTVNVNKKDQVYQLQLKNSAGKAVPLFQEATEKLPELTTEDPAIEDWGAKTTLDPDTVSIKAVEVEPDEKGNIKDYLEISISGYPEKGKVTFDVQRSDWSRPITYVFTVNVTTTLAKVTLYEITDTTTDPIKKVAKNVLTLNRRFESSPAELLAVANQKEAEVAGFDEDTLTFTGSKKLSDEAEELISSMEFDEDRIRVSLPGSDFAKGTYSFKIKPILAYGDDEVPLTTYLAFSIKVVDAIPVFKPKTATLTLNWNYRGNEETSTTYTVTNLPTGGGNTEISFDSSGDDDVVVVAQKNKPELSQIATLVIEDGKMSAVMLDNTVTRNLKPGNYVYTIRELPVATEEDSDVALKDFKVTIKVIKAKPTVTVKAKGTLNPADTTTWIAYTAVLKNLSMDITDLSLQEVNPDTKRYYEEDGEQTPHFIRKSYEEMHTDATEEELEKNKNVYYIVTRYYDEGDEDAFKLENGKSYTLTFKYTFSGIGTFTTESAGIDFVVKPKQTVPAVKVKNKTASLVTGQSDESRYLEIHLTPKTKTGAKIEKLAMTKNNSEDLMKAFGWGYYENNAVNNKHYENLTFDSLVELKDTPFDETEKTPDPGIYPPTFDEDGKYDSGDYVIILPLKDPKQIKENVTYKLNLQAVYYGQMAKTNGNLFSVSFKLEK
ncbi:MAG: leucine-rich repeat domain-containing protein [Lachnospiraceae bacterium]|nr:leucine-rich repeat domain-containing protein [Lachnospiraceae bacterium]